MTHGTYSGYQHHGCRCQPCRDAHYRYPDEHYAEVWLQKWAGARYASPFCRAECAATFLGRSSGAGWTEFFAVPADDWPLLDAALGVAHG